MSDFQAAEHTHRRFNPLSGDWVLVSPHRSKRPWQGLVEEPDIERLPSHDPDCYLCAGNTRVSGSVNPDYQGPYVFENDFAALQHEVPDFTSSDRLLQCESVSGTSRVICFSERHDHTLAMMTEDAIAAVIGMWCEQYRELFSEYQWVQIFENKGAINGCSNPHPHGQVWATASLPALVEKEDKFQRAYFEEHGVSMLLEYAHRELSSRERVVFSNEHWVVVVPWWAVWPFETLLLPLKSVSSMNSLGEVEKNALASIIKKLTVCYDNLFQTSFPYSMGWHCAPGGVELDYWQLHAHFYPPLLRSASVRKFMVGYEMLGEAQRDITAEHAATRLREQPLAHFLESKG